MTSEEAIKEMIRAYDVLDFSCHMDNRRKEAFNMAKSALEQKPCDDAVSRQAVKNGMIKYGFHASDMTVTEFVEDLPSVLPKRKQGEWIEQSSNKEQGEREHIWWKCSQCGQVIFSETEIDRKEFHAFCSKCGAEMR